MISNSTYSFYYRHFISFFLVSAYRHANTHAIPQIQDLKVEINVRNYNRLEDFRDFNYYSFVLLTTTLCTKITFKKLLMSKNAFFNFFFFLGRNGLCFYERFIFFSYAAAHVNPVEMELSSNDFFRFTSTAFRVPETTLYRPGDWLTLNVFDFLQQLTLAVKLRPASSLSLYEQRNFFRLLNIPFDNSN